MTESTEQLIEKYCTGRDQMEMTEDSNEEEYDDWSMIVADAANALKGRNVSARVRWPTGKTTTTSGTVHSIVAGNVYLETDFGICEGDAMTMAIPAGSCRGVFFSGD